MCSYLREEEKRKKLKFRSYFRQELTTTDFNQPINVEKLASGTYILSLTDSDNRNYGQKFIKE